MQHYPAFAGLDIETVPDADLIRKLHPECNLGTDEEVVENFELKLKREAESDKFGSTFPKTIYHRIVSLSMPAWERSSGFELHSFGPDLSEQGIIQNWLALLREYGGGTALRLFTFNGNLFDLNVLRIRCMKYRLSSSAFLDWGQHDKETRFSSYGNRYHFAHVDLLEFISNYFLSPTARCNFQALCLLNGLPGKLGVGGENVREAFFAGRYKSIQQYCDVDALNTMLLGYNVLQACHDNSGRYNSFRTDMRRFFNQDFDDHAGFREFAQSFDADSWFAAPSSKWREGGDA